MDEPEREAHYLPAGYSTLMSVNTVLAIITGWDLRWRMSVIGDGKTYQLVVVNNKEGVAS